MTKKPNYADSGDEIKVRIPAWLYPSTLEMIDKAMELSNCRSRSEFLEKAAQFYAGYVSGESASKFLPAALIAAIRSTILETENRIARLLFKLAVEMDMMMNVLAYAVDIKKEQLRDLRQRCVEEVKRTSGRVTFEDAVDIQRRP